LVERATLRRITPVCATVVGVKMAGANRAVRNLIMIGITVVFLTLGLDAPGVAEPFDEGTAAYEHEDYATANAALATPCGSR
jgi:hypothetical protein